MIALMRSGQVDLSPLITHVYPLDSVNEALAALESREAVRPIVEL
jgi:Zn-dependent alcohol dehydrogenase